jgi:hypothetical protein
LSDDTKIHLFVLVYLVSPRECINQNSTWDTLPRKAADVDEQVGRLNIASIEPIIIGKPNTRQVTGFGKCIKEAVANPWNKQGN